jgi:threonine synthase
MNIPSIKYSASISRDYRNEVYTLDFSVLPSGTHKDIRSGFIVEYAIQNNISKAHMITSGNAGLSLKRAIEQSGADILLTCIVPDTIDKLVALRLISPHSKVICFDLEKRDITQELPTIVEDSFDVTYVKNNPYKDIISKVKGYDFDYVILPIGSGELYGCFLDYFREQNSPTKLIGIIPLAKHPLSKKYARWSEYPNTFADKLACKFMNPGIITKIQDSLSQGNALCEVDNAEISRLCTFSKAQGYSLEPSGAVGLHIPKTLHNKKLLCVLTGNGNRKTRR